MRQSLAAPLRASIPALAFTICLPALGQNLRDVPLGGRTATMGGAGVAAGTDNAMPYLNPAGVAGAPRDVLSISATLYGYATSSTERVHAPGELNPIFGSDMVVSQDWQDSNWLSISPSTAAYFFHLAPATAPQHVVGLSITTAAHSTLRADSMFRAQGSSATLQVDSRLAREFAQYLAGPSYAFTVAEGRVRVGVSVLASLARWTVDNHVLQLLSARVGPTEFPQTDNNRSLVDAWSVGATAVAGLQAELSQDLWAGVAAELNGLPVTGGGTFRSYSDTGAVDQTTGQQAAARTLVTGKFDQFNISRPARLSAGLAYQGHPLALAADVHYRPPWADFLVAKFTGDATRIQTGASVVYASGVKDGVRQASGPTVDASVGLDWALTTDYALRFGLFTDRDIAEQKSPQGVENSRLDWYGATLGLGSFDEDLETTYGLGYRYGDGRAVSADSFGSARPRSVPFAAHGVMLMLSASVRTREGEREKAKRDIEHAVPGPARPARLEVRPRPGGDR